MGNELSKLNNHPGSEMDRVSATVRLLRELRTLIALHARPCAESRLPANIVLVASDRPTPMGQALDAAMDDPAFALVAQGAKRVALGNRAFDFASGQYLIFPLDLPLRCRVVQASAQKPFLAFCLKFKSNAIAALLQEMGSIPKAKVDSPDIVVEDLNRDLIESVVRLLRLLGDPERARVLAPAIEREILRHLINGGQGAMIRQLAMADGRMRRLVQAMRWIRDHYAESLRIEDLAGRAGMSASSFYRNFRALTSSSPLQYQKWVRLQQARARLSATAHDISAVGTAVGYSSRSQFSREYRRRFGAAPGKHGDVLRRPKIGRSPKPQRPRENY